MEVYNPITDNTFWKYKYAPFKIEDIDINKSKLYPIKKWLEDFDKNRELYKSNIKKAKKDKYVDILDIDEIDDNNTDDIILPKKNNNSSNKSCLIITGNHGIGKTHFLVSILNSLKYDIYKINFWHKYF